VNLVERGGAGGRAAARAARPRFMASRRRRVRSTWGEQAADDSTGPRPNPLWGMGGRSEPHVERTAATGEPCARARGTTRRPPPGATTLHEVR